MKVGILAGGFGTRLAEETGLRPKPMVEIGGIPIVWHIMESFARQGHKEFVIALGYKGDVIKDYFTNFALRSTSLTIDLATGHVSQLGDSPVDWKVHLLDTGLHTMTGGRVRQVAEFIGNEPFFLTYGDGLANVDLAALEQYHRRTGAKATLTAVRPPSRFGDLELDADVVVTFREKPLDLQGWINGGFFVVEPEVAGLITGDDVIWEREPLERLAASGDLAAFRHEGFWQCMDTIRDRQILEEHWSSGKPGWLKTSTPL